MTVEQLGVIIESRVGTLPVARCFWIDLLFQPSPSDHLKTVLGLASLHALHHLPMYALIDSFSKQFEVFVALLPGFRE